MTQNDYVSTGVAKLLYEKGYREPARAFHSLNWKNGSYTLKESEISVVSDQMREYPNGERDYLAPTLYEAQVWLLNQGIWVEPKYMYGDAWSFDLTPMRGYILPGYSETLPIEFDTMQDALNTGIREAIKLLK